MHSARNFDDLGHLDRPVYVSLGNFDGLHCGHQAVLDHLTIKAREASAHSLVITFSNHPSTVLRPETAKELLCTLSHRERLIEACGVDQVLRLTFTRQFSQQSAQDFLSLLQRHLPLAGLILGHDAVLGRDRGGKRSVLEGLCKKEGLYLEYLEPTSIGGTAVSSTRIREFVRNGDLGEVSALLGRPYSIYSDVLPGAGKGRGIGYPTINLDVSGLCLPPFGVYAARVTVNGARLAAVANLGFAPTLQERKAPVLEAHILDDSVDLYGQAAEVELIRFIRAEQTFESAKALGDQISKDIAEAKLWIK